MAHPNHSGHNNPEKPKKPITQKPRGGQAMAVTTGVSWPASFTGWAIAFLAGLLLSAFVGLVFAGVGATTATLTGLGVAGGITGLIVWFIAFFIGGWTAGRVAKFSGLLHGLMVWVIGLVFMIILLILAAVISPSIALIGGLSIPVVGNIVAAVGLGIFFLLLAQLLGSLLGGWLATRKI